MVVIACIFPEQIPKLTAACNIVPEPITSLPSPSDSHMKNMPKGELPGIIEEEDDTAAFQLMPKTRRKLKSKQTKRRHPQEGRINPRLW